MLVDSTASGCVRVAEKTLSCVGLEVVLVTPVVPVGDDVLTGAVHPESLHVNNSSVQQNLSFAGSHLQGGAS